MGYLNKETVTVDAILTKKGRELLAQGRNLFNITKFAVSDDEVDYGLYNVAHPLGSEYYGSAIENMPIIEASPDETQNLRYKLVTLTGDISVIPTVIIPGFEEGESFISLNSGGASVRISPSTENGDEAGLGYTLTIFDADAVTLIGLDPVGADPLAAPNFNGGSARRVSTLSGTAIIAKGEAFDIGAANNIGTLTNTQISVTGNATGATIVMSVRVNPETTV